MTIYLTYIAQVAFSGHMHGTCLQLTSATCSVPHEESGKMLGMRDKCNNTKIKQNGRRETALVHGGAALAAVYILRDAR